MTRKLRSVGVLAAALIVIVGLAGATQAEEKTLRIGYQGDALSLDPMADWHALTVTVGLFVYDSLLDYEVDRGFIPRLATRWEMVEPTRWRFWLRKGVKFHDGTDFTADDVVFSIERMGSETSLGRVVIQESVEKVVKVDAYTVDIITKYPDPILINRFNTFVIMSKSWAEAHDEVEPADASELKTTYASTHAMGTGPFILESREPGTRTVFVRNPDWYGWDDPKHPSNVDRVVFTPIESDATRVAALLSGEVDLIVPVPMQDVERVRDNPGTDVVVGQRARTTFLGMDVASEELANSNVDGKNPFADVRVRRAIYQAIDNDTINRVVYRGLVQGANMLIPPGVSGYDPNVKRLPFDPNRARELLAEAGYENGFQVMLDCPSGYDPGDREVCEAVVLMLSRVGIDVELNIQPVARWQAKLRNFESSFFWLSWGPAGWSGENYLNDLLTCREEGARSSNYSGYCNAEFDAIVEQAKNSPTAEERLMLQRKAWPVVREDIPYVPLHYGPVLWGVKAGVEVKTRGEGRLHLPYVVMP